VLAVGLRDIVACGGEDIVATDLGARVDAQARATRRLATVTALRTLIIAVGGWLPVLLLLITGPWLIDRGLTAGVVLGALTYLLQGVYPALQTLVRELGGSGLWLLVALGRISETIDDDQHVAEDGEQEEIAHRVLDHSIAMRNLTFGYGRTAKPIISSFWMTIPEGDHLAIVGPSGVGKSTLAGLLSGVLAPQAGAVTIGGVRIDLLSPQARAAHRALVPQEAYIFAGTLRDNLLYLCGDTASTREVDQAIEALGARSLIDRLGGLDAEVRPAALSAGERQLLTAVRAYLSPAPIVVLDEATCHMDASAEARVEEAFARRPGTFIVVAHRISSALRAQRVLVMDGAKITAGSHDELCMSSALYRDLVGYWQPVAPGTMSVRAMV
jgi:ATP-binding cassette subfamily C protein